MQYVFRSDGSGSVHIAIDGKLKCSCADHVKAGVSLLTGQTYPVEIPTCKNCFKSEKKENSKKSIRADLVAMVFARISGNPCKDGKSVYEIGLQAAVDALGKDSLCPTAKDYFILNYEELLPLSEKLRKKLPLTSSERKESNRLLQKAKKKSFLLKKNPPLTFTNYKSDIEVKSNNFLQTYEWRKIRMEAFKLYGAKCQCCGASPSTGAVLNVDHIKPRKFFPELALDVNNLQILCHECNHGKGNWDQTDWR